MSPSLFASLSPETHEDDLTDGEDDPKKGKKGNKGKGKGKDVSGSQHDGDGLQHGEDTGVAASARKMQNRVAQREFRQRKLQYVKDLEARVEFLSSSKDDQLEALKAMLRGLLEENKQLRTLLQNVTNFVGKGIGGKTHELGFNSETDFEEFVKRADRDTLHNIHEGWKTQYAKNNKVDTGEKFYREKASTSKKSDKDGGAGEHAKDKGAGSQKDRCGADVSRGSISNPSPISNNGSPSNSLESASTTSATNRKRGRDSVENEATASQKAKQRGGGNNSKSTSINNPPSTTDLLDSFRIPNVSNTSSTYEASYNYQPSTKPASNIGPATSSSSFFFDIADPNPPMGPSSFTNDFLAEFAHTGLTPMAEPSIGYSWMDSSTSPVNTSATPSMTAPTAYSTSIPIQNSYPLPARQPLSGSPLPQLNTDFNKTSPISYEPMTSNSLLQAIQIISYHMRNKQANPGYILPMALAPTQMQILTPHDARIDGVLWPSMRDRLIAHPELDLSRVLTDLLDGVNVHQNSTDLLDANYWELSESFIKNYRILVAPEVLTVTNRWRKSRNESEVVH